MIYTLTTNPAIDMNLMGTAIRPNQVNRTENTVYSPNGKGINVTLVLKHFGVNSTVLGFFGGFTGHYIIDELQKREVNASPIWVEDQTRINIFINDGKDEYKFVNRGSFVPVEKQVEFIDKLKGLIDCEYLVISGSLPSGVGEDYYEKILDICHEKSIKVILDISSSKLKNLLKYKPLLIKPNDEEVQKIFGFMIQSKIDIHRVMRFFKAEGVQNVLLTLGEKGSYFSDGHMIYECSAQPVNLISSACAGDAALGAFLSEWLITHDIVKALKKSAAVGANVAESDALGDFKKVDSYINNIQVRKVGTLS